MTCNAALGQLHSTSIEIDNSHLEPSVTEKCSTVRRVHALEDDTPEYGGPNLHNGGIDFQFQPAHPAAHGQKYGREVTHKDCVPRHVHRLDSDDDFQQPAYTGFHNHASNICTSRRDPDSVTHSENADQGSHRNSVPVRADIMPNVVSRGKDTEPAEQLDSDAHYDEQEGTSPVTCSLAGTAQVHHDTPATDPGRSSSAAAATRDFNARSNQPGSASSLATRSARNSSEKSSTKKQDVLGPQNNDNKVIKSPTPNSRSPSPVAGLQSATFSLPNNAEDVEEVLLYLIGQNRRRAASDKGLKATFCNLEAEKRSLQDLNDAQQQELADVQRRWQTAVQNNHVRDAEVRELKSKYENLKKAVYSFALTFEDVKKGRDKLNSELTSLKELNSAAVQNDTEVVKQFTTANDHFIKIRNDIANIRKDCGKLTEIRKGFLEAQKCLQEEKFKNRKYELHIQKLEEVQRVWHTRSDFKQSEIVSHLSSLMKVITSQNSGDNVRNFVQPVVKTLEEIKQRVETLAPAGSLENLLSEGKSSFEGVSNALKDVQKALEDQHAAANLQFSNVISSLSDMKQDSPHLEQLQIDKARLEQEVLASKQKNLSLERSQNSSKLLCTGLLQVQQQILSREQNDVNIAKTIQELSVARDEAIYQVSFKQQENDALQAELHQKAGSLTQLRQELTTLQNESRLEQDKTAKLHEDAISKIRENFATDRHRFEQKVANERGLHDATKQTLIEARSTLLSHEKNAESTCEQIRNLNTRLDQQARHVTTLKTENQLMQQSLIELKGLRQEKEAISLLVEKIQADLRSKCTELQQLKDAFSAKEGRILDLNQVIKDGEAELSVVKTQKDNLEKLYQSAESEHAEHVSSLHGSIASATQETTRLQQDLKKATDAKSTVQKVNDELKVREGSLLKQLEGKDKQILDAENRGIFQKAEAARLREKVNTAQKELDEVQTRCSELTKNHDQQGNKIKDLEQKLKTLTNVAEEVEKVKAASLHKEAEAVQHRTRSEELQQELSRFGPMREYITDAEIEELTEPIILSLKSQIHASQLQKEKGQMRPPTKNSTNEQGTSKSHREEVRSRESQGVIIPDSQSQGAILGQRQDFTRDGSPELLDHSYDLLADIDVNTQAFGNHLHPTSAIQSQGEVFRPGTSNDEMLLRSPDAPSELSQPSYRSTVQVPASTYSTSPMKTRGGSQIRHTVAETQLHSVRQREGTPLSQQKDIHAPNSAAKRQNTGEEGDISGKRPRLQQTATSIGEVQSSTRPAVLTPKETRFANQLTMYPAASTTPKTASIAGASAPVPGSMRKRTNAPKRSSRNTAFGDRFN